MGFFKKMFGNAVDDIKKGFEDGRKKAIEDSKSGTLNSIMNDIKKDNDANKEMMNCPHCGYQISTESAICPSCGQKFVRQSPQQPDSAEIVAENFKKQIGDAVDDPEKEKTPVSGDNEMFSSRLETLINSALKDGVLTDKEREIIKKRAEAEGEDWGEVEMLLDARLEEMQSDPSFLAAQFISIEERLSAKRAEWHSTEIGSDIWKQLAGEQTALKAELDRCKLKLAKIGILDGDRIDYDALSRLINPTSQPQTTINTPAEVSQPQQSEDYADKKMPPRIFGKDSNLKGQNSIVIPEGVEEIADEAFYNFENLQSIILPSSLKKIGKSAFKGTSITEVILPNNVEEIADKAFYNCNRLQKIVFSAALKKIGKSILGDCNRLKNINLSRCTELKTIGEEAFKFIPKQKEISLPDCVTTIEREAFYGVDICHFIMPASLENLENNIFAMYERNIKIDFSKVTKLKVIPSYFCGANELTIPQGVTTIEECAFDPERWDSKLFLPPSLKKIEGEGDEDYGNFDEVFVFSPMIEGLFENIGGTIYVLPEYIEAYKTYCNAIEYERSIELMPDEYLYYYDN